MGAVEQEELPWEGGQTRSGKVTASTMTRTTSPRHNTTTARLASTVAEPREQGEALEFEAERAETTKQVLTSWETTTRAGTT